MNQDSTETAVIVWLVTCAFVLTYVLNGYVGTHVGLHVCFSQPSQDQCGTWVIFIKGKHFLIAWGDKACLDKGEDEQT